ncbi:MAG TPA: hypothetical protein VFH62_02500 [Dehalococcoidia bacterium]|nr:hypothetical protein [Dehalococcoidia bacterium]
MVFARLLLVLSCTTLVVSSACSGGGTAGGQPPQSATLAAGYDATAALAQSALSLAAVDSTAATFEWHIERDGFNIQGRGEYAAKSGEGFQLTAHYEGKGDQPQAFREENDSQLLVLVDHAYVKTPPLGDGWVLFSPSELGSDWDATQRLLNHHSPFDYGTVVQGVAAGAVGLSRIDGTDFVQLKITIDANVLVSALADAYGSQGQIMLANRFSDSVPLNIWIDPSTNLPRRVEADAEITVMGEPARLRISVDYTGYNNVVLDRQPDDATRFAELRG